MHNQSGEPVTNKMATIKTEKSCQAMSLKDYTVITSEDEKFYDSKDVTVKRMVFRLR